MAWAFMVSIVLDCAFFSTSTSLLCPFTACPNPLDSVSNVSVIVGPQVNDGSTWSLALAKSVQITWLPKYG